MQQKLNTEEVEALVAQAGSDPLAVAVHGINLTLAHHAAWTGEEFEKVNERFDAVDQKEAAMGRRFDSLDKRFDAAQLVLSRLDTRTSDMKGVIDGVLFSTSLRGRKLDDLESAQHGVIIRLDALEAGQAETKAWQARADEKLDYLKAADHDRKKAIIELQEGQSQLKAGQGRLEAGMAELGGRQGKLEAGMAELGGRQGKLEAGMAELGGRQGNLETAMQELTAQVTKVLNFVVKGELRVNEATE